MLINAESKIFFEKMVKLWFEFSILNSEKLKPLNFKCLPFPCISNVNKATIVQPWWLGVGGRASEYYTYAFLIFSPPAKLHYCDVIMYAVHFWGQGRGSPVRRECPICCYKVMQVFIVTGLFAGQHNTKLHGTITGVYTQLLDQLC